MPRLFIYLPDGSEKTIVLPKNGEYFARIGRDEHCEIALPFQSVSGEHALLQFKEGGYVLEDLGSTNGTKINGLTPMGAATLYDGDEIALGDPRLRFAEDLSPGFPAESSGKEEKAAPSAAMRNLQQLADEAARTTRNHYLWMSLYAVLIFFLAVFAGLTYKHYRVTGELLPLQWLGIESPKAALKTMSLHQAENGM
ncbi:FHA domain-containing protein [uncultured Akkermansia sp.]|uniref:FHA domain-containing protein n=1 Tax=uncultured Akkermansia sp. TaxID=512294 RepID=UPI0026354537|nr:FHA domain-containing protein [uncultured Akkermansia sp.]